MKKMLNFIALAALSSSAMAVTNVWEGISGDGTSYTDGANWVGATAPRNDLTNDVAQLTGGTVNLDADRSANGLDLATASSLTGTGTRLTLGSGGITGTEGLTLNSGVTLRVGGIGNATGNITIDGAAVEVANQSQGFLGTGTITLDNGGAIIGQGGHVNNRSTTSIILGPGGGTFGNAHTRAFYGLENAVISGTGQLTLDGGGSDNYPGNSRIQLTGTANTYTGGTLIHNKANAVIYGDNSLGASSGKVTLDDGRMAIEDSGLVLSNEIEIASGGGTIALGGSTARKPTFSGPLTGIGNLEINGQNRDNDDGSPNGEIRLTAAGTLSGDVLLREKITVRVVDDALGTGTVTLQENALLRNHNGQTTLENNIVIGSGGARMSGTFSSDFILNGALSGTDELTITSGSGAVILNGDGSAFTGLLTLEDGAELGGTGAIGGDLMITSNALLGVSGAIGGNLTIAEGGMIAFSTTESLTVGGVVTLHSTFGIDDLIGISSNTLNGTYMVIDGDVSASFVNGFENIGLGNAYDLGAGKSAYYQEGSLEVVVIPEPATLGMIAACAGGMFFIRRRFMI